ncbi:putative chromate transport protein [Clostridiales bacterium CHKCI001]|nr:putative chromate transport protein [Clostridiales bacterium CHKCI001]
MKTEKKLSLYCWLFGVNFFISAFTFGGGYVVIPMIRKFFVQKKQLIREEEIMDMSAIAQSSPGAIAINLAVLAGYRVAGFVGAVISCVSAVLPPLIILSLISACYQIVRDNVVISAVLKGMEAGVAALIVDLVVDMCHMIIKDKDCFLTLLMPAAFLASFFFQVNVALIIGICVVLCVLNTWYKKRRKR